MRIFLGRDLHTDDVVQAIDECLAVYYRSELAAGRSVNRVNAQQLARLINQHHFEAYKLQRITGLPISAMTAVIERLQREQLVIVPCQPAADAASVVSLDVDPSTSPRSVSRPSAAALVAVSVVAGSPQAAAAPATPEEKEAVTDADWQQVETAQQDSQEQQTWGQWLGSWVGLS